MYLPKCEHLQEEIGKQEWRTKQSGHQVAGHGPIPEEAYLLYYNSHIISLRYAKEKGS